MAPAAEEANADTQTLMADKKGDAPKTEISIPQLAYDYTYTFGAGPKGVETMIAADQAACEAAGPTACQMISLQSSSDPANSLVRKELELRVTPQWLKAWQAGLTSAVAKAHGRIAEQNVTSEDLSLQIVDSEAHIQNKEALRDRLLQVIKNNTGKIADLIEAETQLSNVQEDIDASRSALAVMQKRVATTHLTLTYVSEASDTSQGVFAPVGEAFRGVLRNMMSVFAALITLLSYLAPLALVAIPALWFGLRWHKRNKVKATTDEKS